ncbi:MAG: hypothetical protein Q6358_09150, partial [Candidatus Brocadiales bacterium]|nr:hypothetical protein [Candidatus Brocadiales bacterium]
IYSLYMICFFIALLPVLNIVPIGHIMADRYLYLPAAGFCTVISGLLFNRVTTQSPVKKQGKFPVYRHSMLNKYTFTVPLISIICVFLSQRLF